MADEDDCGVEDEDAEGGVEEDEDEEEEGGVEEDDDEGAEPPELEEGALGGLFTLEPEFEPDEITFPSFSGN